VDVARCVLRAREQTTHVTQPKADVRGMTWDTAGVFLPFQDDDPFDAETAQCDGRSESRRAGANDQDITGDGC